MTVNSLAAMIGQKALVRMDAFRVLCKILDAKQVYGCTRYLVSPHGGEGEAWVDSSKVYPVENQ